MLIRIIYVSHAGSLLPLDLKDILATARKNNPLLGITGAMCFIDGDYLQCLEGEAEVLDVLYQKIEKDDRHAAPKLLQRSAISERVFPKWAMALLTWNEETKTVFRRHNPQGAFDVYLSDPATVESLLRAWAGTTNWMTV